MVFVFLSKAVLFEKVSIYAFFFQLYWADLLLLQVKQFKIKTLSCLLPKLNLLLELWKFTWVCSISVIFVIDLLFKWRCIKNLAKISDNLNDYLQ